MKVVVRTVPADRPVEWPEGWPVPRAEESVTTSDGRFYTVRAVDWFPEGEDDDREPFVYVVLGAL